MILGRAGVFAFLVQKLIKHHYLLKGWVWVGNQQAINEFQHSIVLKEFTQPNENFMPW